MNESGHYPPPDFGRPPQNPAIHPQTFQYQAPSSGFHPSMWSWNWNWSETPSSPYDYSSAYGAWQSGASSGFGDHGGPYGGSAAPTIPYSQHFYHGCYQGGNRGRGNNYGTPNNHGRKKNKREPEFSHFCDPCDRAFKSQDKYDEHMSQHVKCSVPDCSFTAHEKIVSIHWRNNHAPGAKKIKLDTAEDIAKWRQERRKNYPTLENVEKKRKILGDREVCGAVLDTAQFGRMRGRGRGRGRGNRRFQRGYQGDPVHPGSGVLERPPPLSQQPRHGDPLGALVNSDPDSGCEDPAGDTAHRVLVVPPKQMSSGLGALVANYGSMSDSDEEPDCLPVRRAEIQVKENQALLQSVTTRSHGANPFSRGDPDTGLGPYTPGGGRGGAGRGRGRHRKRGNRGGRNKNLPKKRCATLLEMLLATDIRHERNLILQCVRYIVRNNFFGLEDGPKSREGDSSDTRPQTSTSEGASAVERQPPPETLTLADAQHDTKPSLNCADGSRSQEAVRNRGGSLPCELDSLEPPTDAQNAEETESLAPAYLYDDEIWESP